MRGGLQREKIGKESRGKAERKERRNCREKGVGKAERKEKENALLGCEFRAEKSSKSVIRQAGFQLVFKSCAGLLRCKKVGRKSDVTAA